MDGDTYSLTHRVSNETDISKTRNNGVDAANTASVPSQAAIVVNVVNTKLLVAIMFTARDLHEVTPEPAAAATAATLTA